jgi:predicted transcriptional regulator
MHDKKQMIAAIRREIDQLEQDVSLESGTRASLHAMNLRLLKALELMDGVVGDLDQVVEEAHRVPRSRLGRLIASLQALIQQWRAFKGTQEQELVRLEGSQQDRGRL